MHDMKFDGIPRWMFCSLPVRMAVEHLNMTAEEAVAALPHQKGILVTHSDPCIYPFRIHDAKTNQHLGGCTDWETINEFRMDQDGHYLSPTEFTALFVR
jgi:hypothetical protein